MTHETKTKLNSIAELALSRRETVYNSYELAKRCIDEGIPGDFVECGVFAGAQVAAMAQACIDHDVYWPIHLFDSFEGIPKAGPEDGEEGKKIEGKSICSMEKVKGYMRAWGIDDIRLFYHRGWFENTVPDSIVKKIAILRLDGDLYSSTKVCLEHLLDKIVDGGFLIVDDYALPGCRKAVDEFLPNDIFTEVVGGAGVVWARIER